MAHTILFYEAGADLTQSGEDSGYGWILRDAEGDEVVSSASEFEDVGDAYADAEVEFAVAACEAFLISEVEWDETPLARQAELVRKAYNIHPAAA